MRVILILFVSVASVTCFNYLTASNRRLSQILESEASTARILRSKLDEEATIHQRLISRFSKLSSQSALGSRDDYVTSPLPALVMIRRLVEDWTALAGMARQESGLHQLGLRAARWPTPYHLMVAAYSVMRSQWTYGLNTQALAAGEDRGTALSNVTAADCFHVGLAFMENKTFKEAVEWFQQALYKTSLGDNTVARQTVELHWVISNCYSGNKISASELQPIDMLRHLLQNKQSITHEYLLEYYKEMGKHDCVELMNKTAVIKEQGIFGGLITGDTMEQHRHLCRGQGGSHRRLRCRYLHHNLHHLRLRPFKLEELHLDPPVLRFYDVITDPESLELQRFASNYMEPAADLRDGVAFYDNFRTSHVAWVYPGECATDDLLSRRMADMTQMEVRTAEVSQITRYCISGEYLPHFDFHQEGWNFLTNRIASLMFYLNDVKSGGYTIFPKLNVSVEPIKNSAILWFNFLPSGDVDPLSEHSGCPVLYGTKWVLVKWFLNGGQEFKNNCGLQRNATFINYYAN